ncbi:MAG: hypothetical protein M1426_01865 [Patescibacteria group bacterium]|nr:hypothetical protein [Patescibacteria group bacterium]
MRFYNVKARKPVEIPDDQVKVVTMKNGRKAAEAEAEGVRMFKIISNEEAARLAK